MKRQKFTEYQSIEALEISEAMRKLKLQSESTKLSRGNKNVGRQRHILTYWV